MQKRMLASVVVGAAFYSLHLCAMASGTFDSASTRKLIHLLSHVILTQDDWSCYKKDAERHILNGADPNALAANCVTTLLIQAAVFEDEDFMRFLLERGASPKKSVESPVFNTYSSKLLRMLLDANADVSGIKLQGPLAGYTLLHLACCPEYKPDAVALLCGAMDPETVGAVTPAGNNALHLLAVHAYDYPNERCGELFLKAESLMPHICIDQENKEGKTPLQVLDDATKDKELAPSSKILRLAFEYQIRSTAPKTNFFGWVPSWGR